MAAPATCSSNGMKKHIINVVKDMTVYQQIEILKLLKKHESNYTENNNGIFFDINLLTKDAIAEIYNYIVFCNNVNNNFEINTDMEKMQKSIEAKKQHKTTCDYDKHKKNITERKLKMAKNIPTKEKVSLSSEQKALLQKINSL